jgi:hypothetical protein
MDLLQVLSQLLTAFASYFFDTMTKFMALYLSAVFFLLLLTGSRSGLLALGAFIALVGIGHLLSVGFNPIVLIAVAVAGVALVMMARLHPDGVACVIYILILISIPILLLAMFLVTGFVLVGLGMAIVAAALWAIYLFLTASPLIKAAVVAGAVGTALVVRRLRGKKAEQNETLLDTEQATQP